MINAIPLFRVESRIATQRLGNTPDAETLAPQASADYGDSLQPVDPSESNTPEPSYPIAAMPPTGPYYGYGAGPGLYPYGGYPGMGLGYSGLGSNALGFGLGGYGANPMLMGGYGGLGGLGGYGGLGYGGLGFGGLGGYGGLGGLGGFGGLGMMGGLGGFGFGGLGYPGFGMIGNGGYLYGPTPPPTPIPPFYPRHDKAYDSNFLNDIWGSLHKTFPQVPAPPGWHARHYPPYGGYMPNMYYVV